MGYRRTVLASSALGLALVAGPLISLAAVSPAVDGSDEAHAPKLAATSVHRATPRTQPSPDTHAASTVEPTHASAVVWAQGGFDPRAVDAAAGIDDVVAATFVRSGIVGLTASRDASGTLMVDLHDGFRIPVRVSAIDPRTYPALLDTDDPAATALAGLESGEVALSETGAKLRGIDVGGRIDLADARGLMVVAVVGDDAANRAEIIAHHDDADALGLSDTGSITIRHRAASEADRDALAEELQRLTDGARVRFRDHGPHGGAALVLSFGDKKLRFGEFAYRPRDGVREIDVDPSFRDEFIVTERIPVIGEVRCHRDIMDDLRRAIDEVIDAGLQQWLAPPRYGGCHHPRRISTAGDGLSSHSWGIAIDINVDLDMPGLGPVPPDEFIDIFGRNGFRWGGDFSIPDNHHYEWVGEAASRRPTR